MKIRAIQFSPNLGNVKKNLEFHLEEIEKAVKDKIDLIIFPELSLSGYLIKDMVHEIMLKPEDAAINTLLNKSETIDIVVGAPVEDMPGIVHNCALYLSNGKLLHNHRKVQLPNFGMFEEEMIFKAGDTFKAFDIDGFKVGMIICREILFPPIAYLYFLQHVDLLIGISNSPFRGMANTEEGFPSLKLWERMGEVFSIHHHMNYVFVNRSGWEDGLGFGGGSFFSAPGKGIVKKAAYFEADTMDFEIDKESVRRARMASNYLRDDKPEVILKQLQEILNA